MEKNLLTLVETPDAQRDEAWEDQFLHALSESSVRILSQDPQYGPDGWPYLMVETVGEALEPVQKIFHWLATRGIGFVINPQKQLPDYILTYGMIWSFRETGRFFDRKVISEEGAVEVDLKKLQHAGQPSPQYLPDYVRKVLREFLRDQGVLAPKILVLSTDKKHYDLAFSLESLGQPPEVEWPGIAETLAWFLPPHYSLILASEKNLSTFFDL